MNEPSDDSHTQRRFAPERILVMLLAVVPLLPTLRAQFIYDDTTIIRDNTLLRGWGALVRVWTTPYWPSDGVDSLGLYRPLQLALLSVVWNLTGGAAQWFHLYALILTALTALAAWWLIRKGVGALPALVAAAWFATHPLHIEAAASVANTSELVVVLCVVGLTALLGGSDETRSARAEWGRTVAFGLLAGAALAAKESGLLAVPLALVTAWGWSAAQEHVPMRDFVRRHARFVLASVVAVSAIVLVRLVVLGSPVSHGSIAAQGLSGLTTSGRLGAMMSLWPRVAGMLLWPTSLSPYYGPTTFPENGRGLALLSATVVLALSVLAVLAAKRGDRRALVGTSWIVLSYLPASNLITPTGQILSDRTLFGATVGVAMLLALVLEVMPRFIRRASAVICALVIARSAIYGTHYAVAWTSHRALWTWLAEVSPNEHLSYKLLGMDARARGDTAAALTLLERANAMAPLDRQIRFEYGQVLYSTGRYASAEKTLAPLLRDGDARSEPGFVALYLDAVGRASGPEAVVQAARTLLHSESTPVAALFLGVALEQLGRPAAADSAYAAGLMHTPSDSALLARRAALGKSRVTSAQAVDCPPPVQNGVSNDNVFVACQTTKPVHWTRSPVPRYPKVFVAAGVPGTVQLQFIVGKNGRADITSIGIFQSSHQLFEAAVREAIVGWTAEPARVGRDTVRQLVRAKFVFTLVAAPRACPRTREYDATLDEETVVVCTQP
ncbi:MAG: tetratricopeptide repeat protein [Gemmatimonadota bacterium]